MFQSLRARLVAMLLAITAFTWLLIAVAGQHESRHELEEIFDAEMMQIAKLLAGLARDGTKAYPAVSVDQAPYHDYEKKLSYAAWNADGTRILAAGETAPMEAPVVDEPYGFLRIGREQWRSLTLHTPEGITVRVAEQSGARDEYAANVGQRLLLPLLAAVPLIIVSIWMSVGRALGPLERIAASVAARHPLDLQPLRDDAPLREIAPLVTALNALLQRLEFAFNCERHFTADAAHELQTPLAGLSAQYEVAMAAGDTQLREHALEQIRGAIEHMSQLVRQLLALARCDALSRESFRGGVDLDVIVRDVLLDLTEPIKLKHAEVTFHNAAPMRIEGHAMALSLAVRNVLDNALRYGPQGARVHISLSEENDGISLHIADNGPGISAAERERVFQRFYRCRTDDARGTGLGLCIVRRCIEVHCGTVTLGDSRWGGLAVKVWLPKKQLSLQNESIKYSRCMA